MWEAQRNIPEEMGLMSQSSMTIYRVFESLRFNISQITVAPGDPYFSQILTHGARFLQCIPVITLKLNSFILIGVSKYGLMTLAVGY